MKEIREFNATDKLIASQKKKVGKEISTLAHKRKLTVFIETDDL